MYKISLHIRYFALVGVAVFVQLIMLTPTVVSAQDNWFINIEGSTKVDTDRVMVGVNGKATNGFDVSYDATSTFKAGSEFALYMNKPEWGRKSPYGWVDIREDKLPHVWSFNAYTSDIRAQVSLGWDTSTVPAGVNLILTDHYSGVVINMKDKNSHSFTSVTKNRFFSIKASNVVK